MKHLLTIIALLFISSANAEDFPPVRHVIDTHIHLYDTTREVKVTWPKEHDKVLYKPHLPAEYSRVAKAAGVTGVVIVEASNRFEDNKWVLDLVEGDDFYVALVGNLDVYRDDFEEKLIKFKQERRLVGIRARGPKPIDYSNETVLKNLAILAKHDLAMDYLGNGGGTPGVQTIDKLARQIPNLRIVANHCLGYDFDGNPPPADWVSAVERLAENKNVTCKISGLYQRSVPQPAPQSLDHYEAALEELWKNFGADRLIYGSNWPCTKNTGSYISYRRLVEEFFAKKGQAAREQYYWKNAARVYRLPLE